MHFVDLVLVSLWINCRKTFQATGDNGIMDQALKFVKEFLSFIMLGLIMTLRLL